MATKQKESSPQWFYTGQEGWKKAKQSDEEAKARRDQQGTRRFYLKSDTSGRATFLDTPNFFVYEHNMKIGDNFHNYFTCRKDFGACPLCDAGVKSSMILVGTVINHTAYTNKENKEVNHVKQLFVAKSKAREHLQKAIERAGEKGLRFAMMECTRGSSPTECATGEDFFLKGYLSEEKLKAARDKYGHEYDLKPFDYSKLFYPKTEAELRKLVGAGPPIGSEEEADSASADELLTESVDTSDGESIDDLI